MSSHISCTFYLAETKLRRVWDDSRTKLNSFIRTCSKLHANRVRKLKIIVHNLRSTVMNCERQALNLPPQLFPENDKCFINLSKQISLIFTRGTHWVPYIPVSESPVKMLKHSQPDLRAADDLSALSWQQSAFLTFCEARYSMPLATW